MSFTRGGASLPLTDSLAFSLADDADPALTITLRYLASVLRSDCQARFQAELTKASVAIPENPDGYLPQTLLPLDLASLGPEAHLVFPILGLHRQDETYFERTLVRKANTSVWILRLLLPSGWTLAQSVALQPILKAASKSLRFALETSQHPSQSSRWIDDTGIDVIKPVSTAFAFWSFPGNDLQFAGLEMRIEVEEHDLETTVYPDLQAIDGYVSTVQDGYSDVISEFITSF